MRDAEFKQCPMRTEMVAFRADGTKERVHRCGEPSSDNQGQFVTVQQCDECPVRAAVLQAAIQAKTYQPERKFDDSRAVSKKPDKSSGGFPACQDRNLVIMPGCCQSSATLKVWVCNSQDCPAYGAEVTPVYCGQCRVRRP